MLRTLDTRKARSKIHQRTNMRNKKKYTEKTDDAYDKKRGIKEGSKKDMALDKKRGITEDVKSAKKVVKKAMKKKGKIAMLMPMDQGAMMGPGQLPMMKKGNKLKNPSAYR